MFKSILFTVFSLLFICGSISSYSIRRSSSSSSSIHSSVQRVLRDYDASIESLRTLHSTFQVLADPASNAACSSALTAADASIKANCSATFLSSESLDLAPLLAENAVVGPICATKIASTDAAKCIAAFTAAYQSSINICGANNSTDVVAKIQAAVGGESFFNGLSQLVTLGQAICTKDGDTYCYDALNTLVKASGNPFSNIANINNTVASALCTPCSKKFLNNLQSVGVINITAYPSLGGLLTGLKFICISDPTNPSNQCMDSVALLTKFQGQNAAGISNIISTLSKTDVNLLCSPCTSAVINSADTLTAVGVPANAIAALKAAGPYIAGLCVKDASNGNDYCAYRLGGPLGQWATAQISSVANLAPLYTACKTSFDEGFTTCSAGCSAAISALFAQFGCCLGVATDNGKNKDPFIAAIQAAAASAPSGTTDQIVLALQKCTITFVQSCAPPTAVPLSVTFILDNIKSSWATDASVLTDFKNAFTADVASAFGLDASAITGITVADNGKGATKITFTINTKADIVAGLKATIVSRINTKTMTFGQTSALAASNAAVAKVDASSGVEASTTSTVDGGGASAAFVSKNIMGSFVLTILSFIAIKLF